MQPEFVLPTPEAARERHGTVDLYLPEADGPRPAIVFVHGGYVDPEGTPPRDWFVYIGYSSAAAARGCVGVMLDHPLHGPDDRARSAEAIAAAVAFARADPRVDQDRIALWGFSAGAWFLPEYLRQAPPWLRCVGVTYPAFDDPSEALHAGSPPMVVTVVGRERPELAAKIPPVLAAARAHGVPLDVIDVPNGQHGFDALDHTDESRKAVERAFDLVLARLTA